MADREKVAKGLEYCIGHHLCLGCGYYAPNNARCQKDLMRDALELLKDDETQLIYRDEIIKAHEDEIERLNELLKEREPVESEGENCGECGYTLHRINYDGPDKELRHEEVSGDASER